MNTASSISRVRSAAFDRLKFDAASVQARNSSAFSGRISLSTASSLMVNTTTPLASALRRCWRKSDFLFHHC